MPLYNTKFYKCLSRKLKPKLPMKVNNILYVINHPISHVRQYTNKAFPISNVTYHQISSNYTNRIISNELKQNSNDIDINNISSISDDIFFCDESIVAVLYVCNCRVYQGIYSIAHLINETSNLLEFEIEKERSIFRNTEDQNNGLNNYLFTTEFLKNNPIGKVVVKHSSVAKTHKINYEDYLNRFSTIMEYYNLKHEQIESVYNNLISICGNNLKSVSEIENKIEKLDRKPRIMLSIYGFVLGGGEIMPIRIANELHKKGYPVLVHSFNDKTYNVIRNSLNQCIPVIYCNESQHLNALINDLDVDCINVHHASNEELLIRLNVSKRIPIIATQHGMYNTLDKVLARTEINKRKDTITSWTYVAERNLDPFKEVYSNTNNFYYIPNGIDKTEPKKIDIEKYNIDRKTIKICLASRAVIEKGWIIAIDAVSKARKRINKDICLILVGDGEYYEQLTKDKVPPFVKPVGYQDNVIDWFYTSDICILPTYYVGESAPLSILEMMYCEKPIIATDIGDIRKMISYDGQVAGELLSLNNGVVSSDELCEKIIKLINNPNIVNKYKTLERIKKKEYSIEEITKKYLEVYELNIKENVSMQKEIISNKLYCSKSSLCKNETLKVSVIVPNYNYDKYLVNRLDSIYNQTYKNIEVILLDDYSSDDSIRILKDYKNKYSKNTKLIRNRENSGSVFKQWRKGVLEATGDICWIAEADDYCNNKFIENLVRYFNNKDVDIAYGFYKIVDENDNEIAFKFEDIFANLDKKRWTRSYTNNGVNELQYLGQKNYLINTSGVLMRRKAIINSSVFNDDNWKNMKICGDWLLYIDMLRHGNIAYCPESIDYFRMSKANKSAGRKTYKEPIYYLEHRTVAEYLRNECKVSDGVLDKNRANIIKHLSKMNISKHKKKLMLKVYDEGEKALEQKPK